MKIRYLSFRPNLFLGIPDLVSISCCELSRNFSTHLNVGSSFENRLQAFEKLSLSLVSFGFSDIEITGSGTNIDSIEIFESF